MIKRLIATILVLTLTGSILYYAFGDYNKQIEESEVAEVSNSNVEVVPDDTIVIWYTDDSLTEYINDVSLSYRNSSGMKVRAELVDGVGYLEKINDMSISDTPEIPAPDLYITTHDNLMKAYLAGLASEVSDSEGLLTSSEFPDTSLHAVRCNNKYVAYPLYYETNFFLYNKTYMASIAQNRIESESDMEEAKESEEELNAKLENGEKPDAGDATEEEILEAEMADEDEDPMGEEDSNASAEVLEKLATMIPSTIADVITFANNYEAPDAVEAVFKWDISDIFYNYFFVGNYMEVGGEDGDNNAIFNLYNQQAVQCLSTYQSMNQYFSIDSAVDNYDNILQEFIDGKLVFTVATTDAIAKITEAKAEGKFDFDYGITVLPDMSDLLKARGLSVTDAVVVNGYSSKKQAANEFASFLSYKGAEALYSKTGKLACKKGVKYENDEIYNVLTEYEKSMPLPKMIETSNFWLQLEIALSQIWNGEDPDTVLKDLSDKIGGQIDEITYSIPVQESIEIGGAGLYK